MRINYFTEQLSTEQPGPYNCIVYPLPDAPQRCRLRALTSTHEHAQPHYSKAPCVYASTHSHTYLTRMHTYTLHACTHTCTHKHTCTHTHTCMCTGTLHTTHTRARMHTTHTHAHTCAHAGPQLARPRERDLGAGRGLRGLPCRPSALPGQHGGAAAAEDGRPAAHGPHHHLLGPVAVLILAAGRCAHAGVDVNAWPPGLQGARACCCCSPAGRALMCSLGNCLLRCRAVWQCFRVLLCKLPLADLPSQVLWAAFIEPCRRGTRASAHASGAPRAC